MSAYPKRSVYLAGPITGLTHDESRYGWREEFATLIEKFGWDHIHCFSPMRGKGFLKDFGPLTSGEDYPIEFEMATQDGITTRDFNDVRFCDVVLGCFLESQNRLSGGTFMEYGAARILQKPIVTVGHLTRDEHGKIITEDPNIKHLMALSVSGYHLNNLEDAAIIIGHLLTPGI